MQKSNEKLFQEFWEANQSVYPTTHSSAAKAIFINACMLKEDIKVVQRDSKIIDILYAEKKRLTKSRRTGVFIRLSLIERIIKKVKEL